MKNSFLKRILLLGLVGATIIIVLLAFDNQFMCSVKESNLQADIQNYATKQDPESCDNINTRIMQLESQCKSNITILDCG